MPNLLPGSQYVSEQNIETDRTTLKADLVYNIKYRGLPHILNMELQTDADEDMPIRMLKYHVGLLDKHRKPVISMVMYPFETKVPETPFKEMSGDGWLLQLNYKVLLLWKLEAQQFVQDHVVGMYTLLPAMRGVNSSMLLQAIKEMELKYRFPQLGHHLVRFRTVLRRSKTLSVQDKRLVEEHMQTYDSLLDSDPYIQQKVALERTLERNEAVQAFRDTLIEITRNRFPTLTEIAQRRVAQIQTIESLQQLVVQLSLASDQATARRLLQISSAG
ncbi:MAG TPA: hypothetical protein VIZ18_20005 [Ktedonobacteraceae bacterium]